MGGVSTPTVALETRRRRLVVVLAALYAWVAGQFTPFTWPAAVLTFLPGLTGLLAATRVPRGGGVRPGRARLGWLAWVVVLGGIVGLEAASFFLGSSTHGHPTISNIANHALHTDLTRAVAFFGWMAFGGWLLRR
jgi:hypothetical protein